MVFIYMDAGDLTQVLLLGQQAFSGLNPIPRPLLLTLAIPMGGQGNYPCRANEDTETVSSISYTKSYTRLYC